MKHLVGLLLALSICNPAIAEDDDGMSLMERGAQLFMEGILKEMEPAIEGLGQFGPEIRNFFQEMGPALGDLLEQVEDWSLYAPPEMLPNGDIIFRRKKVEDAAPDTDLENLGEPVDI
ncbi:MAG: hypothetical protein ABJL99_18170 [Aliishimia sp.]